MKKQNIPEAEESEEKTSFDKMIFDDKNPHNPTTLIYEGTIILLMAFAIFLIMALCSHSADDPGWMRTGQIYEIHNIGGKVGAWLADLLFTFFGVTAFLWPITLLERCWLFYRERGTGLWFDWKIFLLRCAGFLLCLMCAATLATLQQDSDQILPYGAGGILGQQLSMLLLPLLSLHGTALAAIALLLLGITLFTDLSWFTVLDGIKACLLRFFRWTRAAWLQHCEQLQEREQIWERQQCSQKSIKDSHQLATSEMSVEDSHQLPVKDTHQLTSSELVTIEDTQQSIKDSHQLGSEPLANMTTAGLPTLGLLDQPNKNPDKGFSSESLESMSRLLEMRLKEFGVDAEVVAVHPGPVITRFEIQPAAGVKVSKITNLAKDLARSLAVISVRVVEVIPGKSVVGIEIPNEDREMVFFSELIGSKAFGRADSLLSMALGHDIAGQPVVANLAKMPHLLVAGTTGSGKSVGVNAMILSLLYKASPADVRLLMVDPKMLELSVYDGIPHLLTPVITDMKEAANGLRWCVAEMERRYRLLAAMGVRNIASFNQRVEEAIAAGEPMRDPLWQPKTTDEQPPLLTTLPFIVVVIDEFADMMMIVGKKVEELIARIAQKARAAGIHLILATQRPSVDVITGLIKANVPTRISFQVSSKIDSRTILDQGGAEQLLGHGDMLYLPPGSGVPVRVHGAFVSDEEVHRVVADWKQRGQPHYLEGILDGSSDTTGDDEQESDAEQDPLYDEAVAFVVETRKASISLVQRRLKIGFNRSANIIEAMERAGVISPAGSGGSREVLVPAPVKKAV